MKIEEYPAGHRREGERGKYIKSHRTSLKPDVHAVSSGES